jgi:hypothetical protein
MSFMICSLHKYCEGNVITVDKMGRVCGIHVKEEKCTQSSDRNTF